MKKLLLFALLCVPAFGQVHSDIATQNTVGNWVKAIPGAFIYVCDPNTTNANCLIGLGGTTLYTDANLSVTLAQPITADSNGNYTFYATPGIYNQCVKGTTSFCQLIEVAGIGTPVGVPFTCPSAVNGSIMGMTSTTTSSCDPNGITDFLGHWTSQSYRATGAFNGTVELTGGLSDPTNPPDTNSVAFLAPLTVPTPFYLRPPASIGTVGQCLQLLSQASGTNGTIDALQWATCGTGSGSVTSFSSGNLSPLFTTSVATATTTPALTFALSNAAANTVLANLTGSSGAPSYTATQGTDTKVLSSGTVSGTSQPLCTDANGGATTVSCPTGGLPTTTIGTPTAPTLTNQNAAGARSITYLVQGCEDPGCVYHTLTSSTTNIANANASPQVLLSAYGDTLYGPRCYDVRVTADSGGRALGLIAHCVGKKFIDTGAAGDGTSATNTNTTILTINMSPNPGCNIPPNGIIGVDAPPCSPTATDDEMQQTSGAPGNSQNPFWTWVNQGAASATWSGGTIVFTLDTNAASSNFRMLQQATPATPYTYIAYFDQHLLYNFDSCGLGLRESSTGKASDIVIQQNQIVNNNGANGSQFLIVHHWSNNTTRADAKFINYQAFGGLYVQIQNTGTNLIYSYSFDGIFYEPLLTELVTAAFTTAPNQVGLDGDAYSATGTSTCVYDFVRRTQ